MQDYVVQVENGIVIGTPILKAQADSITFMDKAIVYLPCNYGEYRPKLDMISTGTIINGEVYYIITPISDELILGNLKKAKAKEIRKIGDSKLKQVAGDYQSHERETWAIQAREAEAYLVDELVPTPIIDAIASARYIAKADLVAKIIENTNLFRAISGTILGEQQRYLDIIDAATTAAEVEAISWS